MGFGGGGGGEEMNACGLTSYLQVPGGYKGIMRERGR